MNSRAPRFDEDPPLDEAGELRLSRDLQHLADALRGEAARLGERAVPQVAAGNLKIRLADRSRRLTQPAQRARTWLVTSGGVALTALTWLLILAAWPFPGGHWLDDELRSPPAAAERSVTVHAEPQSLLANSARDQETSRFRPANDPGPAYRDEFSETAGSWAWGLEAQPSAYLPEGSVGPFLAQQVGAAGELLEIQGTWLGDPKRLRSDPLTSSEAKMRLLEQALDRYRSVIEFQQEQIRRDQEDLQAARTHIEQLEHRLQSAGIPVRGAGE